MNNCKCQCPDFKTHINGIHFAVGPAARQVAVDREGDKRIVRDHASYKRLRAEGLQPKSVKGVSQIEKHATDTREITEGQLMSQEKITQRNIVREAMGEAGMIK